MPETRPIHALSEGDHACLTYSDAEECLDLVAEFVGRGLDDGQQVICLTDTLTGEQLCAQLTSRQVAAGPAAGRGQLQVHNVQQIWLSHGGLDVHGVLLCLDDQIRRARRDGYPGVRVVCDMSWASRPVPGVEHLAALEAQLTARFSTAPVTSICQYDRQRFDPVTLAVAADTHPCAVAAVTYHDDALLRICRQYRPPGIRVAGEIDYQSVEDLRTALSEAVRLDPHIEVNLTHLRFIDATAAGEILNAAATLGPDRRMTVRATADIIKVLTVINPSPLAQLRTVVVDERD